MGPFRAMSVLATAEGSDLPRVTPGGPRKIGRDRSDKGKPMLLPEASHEGFVLTVLARGRQTTVMFNEESFTRPTEQIMFSAIEAKGNAEVTNGKRPRLRDGSRSKAGCGQPNARPHDVLLLLARLLEGLRQRPPPVRASSLDSS